MKLVAALDIRAGEAASVQMERIARWVEKAPASVVDLVYVDPKGDWHPNLNSPALRERITRELQQMIAVDRATLTSFLAKLPASNRGEVAVLAGDPVEVLFEVAKGYDAVIVGPGKKGFERLLLGSIANRVVGGAPVPVLVLRP